MALFDEAGRVRIAEAVAAVERETAGEIVVVSVPSAEPYSDLRALGASAAALASAVVVHTLWPALAVTWLLWVELLAFAGAWFVFAWPPLLRVALPVARAQRSVERRAREELLEQRVLETEAHTGVLILLCELEHRVVILGDRGVHARVQTDGWQQHVTSIVAAIRAKHAADGVCKVISELGAVLARDLPRSEGDVNELPDAPREPVR
jgi:putative membrane protein